MSSPLNTELDLDLISPYELANRYREALFSEVFGCLRAPCDEAVQSVDATADCLSEAVRMSFLAVANGDEDVPGKARMMTTLWVDDLTRRAQYFNALRGDVIFVVHPNEQMGIVEQIIESSSFYEGDVVRATTLLTSVYKYHLISDLKMMGVLPSEHERVGTIDLARAAGRRAIRKVASLARNTT